MREVNELDRIIAEKLEPEPDWPSPRRNDYFSAGKCWEWRRWYDKDLDAWTCRWEIRDIHTDAYAALDALERWSTAPQAKDAMRNYIHDRRYLGDHYQHYIVLKWRDATGTWHENEGLDNDFAAAASAALDAWAKEEAK